MVLQQSEQGVRSILEWAAEQRGVVSIMLAIILFAITLVLRYGFGVWWPWGIVMATILGIVGCIAGSSE